MQYGANVRGFVTNIVVDFKLVKNRLLIKITDLGKHFFICEQYYKLHFIPDFVSEVVSLPHSKLLGSDPDLNISRIFGNCFNLSV